MRSFLIVAAAVVLSTSLGGVPVALAQPNDVRRATTPEGQVPVVPAVDASRGGSASRDS